MTGANLPSAESLVERWIISYVFVNRDLHLQKQRRNAVNEKSASQVAQAAANRPRCGTFAAL